LNALFWGTKVSKHPFYSIRPEMMFGSVSEHFANIRHVKRCKTCVFDRSAITSRRKKMKTCVSDLNALFRGTKVVNHLFYSIGPKMMFVSVSKHFDNLRHIKRYKTCVSGMNALFQGTKVAKHPFYSIRHKMMFGSVSEHFANLRHVIRCKLVFRA
jgi:hypothetical protein